MPYLRNSKLTIKEAIRQCKLYIAVSTRQRAMRFLSSPLCAEAQKRYDGLRPYTCTHAQAFIQARPSVRLRSICTISRIGIVGVRDLTGSDCTG